MASLHRQSGNRPGYKLRFRDTDNRQRVLWLGDVSKRNAETVARHVSELERAFKGGVSPEPGTAKWANELTGRIRERLAVYGFVGSERKRVAGEASRMVKPFFESYIGTRTDWKSATRYKYELSAKYFVRFVGPDRLLADVTPADIDAWRMWLVSSALPAKGELPERGMAISSANKHAKRIKKLFAQAVRAKLLVESPSADQRIGPEVNRARDFYIDRKTTNTVLEGCDTEWGLIFGLCRYAGLRCPTEILGLTWADVDLAAGRLRIDSVKTGLRFCPIFPELRPLIEAARYLAPEGTNHCVRRYRGNATNLRTQLGRILSRVGVVPWPKLFVNLRASARTDLQEIFPSHVCDSWLGHSTRIAERHYLQTTESHWEKAVSGGVGLDQNGGNAGGNIGANQEASSVDQDCKNPGIIVGDCVGFAGIVDIVPPQGLEPWTR
ncbi:MAG: phage integrase SAM-like domain-containing protein [Planctomycetota bacterium]